MIDRMITWTQGFPVKTIDVSNPEWKLLGEFDLAFSAGAAGVIPSLLEELLEPLALSADLMTRFLNSAQEAVARIMQSNSAVLEVGHVHLLILMTAGHSAEGKTWGFFRIEKIDGAGNDRNPPDHSIELYLYTDV
jgi:hypothetical protein